jgi:hypothetical protein
MFDLQFWMGETEKLEELRVGSLDHELQTPAFLRADTNGSHWI